MPEEPATPDLVELTQRAFDAVDRRDFDVALSLFAPDAVWASEVLETNFEGAPEIREFLERWSSAYEAFDVQAESIIDFGSGVVLCSLTNTRPAIDGVSEPGLRFALVIVWAEGVIRSVRGDEDLDEARAAAERLAEERG